MERSNFWTFLGLGLALGICLEVMKHPAAKTNVRLAGFTRFETLLAEGRQVYIPDEPSHESPKKRAKEEEKIVPHQLTADELPPTDAPAPAASPSPTPKPETPEEKKKREEAEKKKKQQEKKKALKEKLRKEEEERKAKAAGQHPTSGDEKKKDEDTVDDNPPPAPYTSVQMLPGAGTPDNPKTVAEWEAYLMKDVDYSRMDRFVKSYQTGEVSPETFYTVISDMLQDHRPEIHTLAIVGLGATPSQQSFDMLITVSTTDAYSSARSQASTSLDSYARLENLRFLMNVITSSHNQNSVVQAIRLVQSAAKSTLKSRSSGGPTTQSTRISNTNLARYYQPFVTVLTTASQSATQAAAVRQSARSALQDVQSLLSSLQQQQSPLNGGNGQPPSTTP